MTGPEWLSIDGTGLVTGVPPADSEGEHTVMITAETDRGLMNQTYTLTVGGAAAFADNDDVIAMLFGLLAFLLVMTTLLGMCTRGRGY